MAEGRRHATFSDKQIQEKIKETVPKNTRKSNKVADKILREYLRDKGFQNLEYVHYSKEELNDVLKKFWFEVRRKKKDPNQPAEEYSKATLQNIRHAINRNLHEAGYFYDITTDPAFGESKQSYKAACSDLKKKGQSCY